MHNNDDLAWVIGGDFNATLLYEEKEGGVPVRDSQIEQFRAMMDDCGLQDLDYVGDMFTWSNCQMASDQINERLDRFIANESFCQLFPQWSVNHLNWARSDHRPIMLHVSPELGNDSHRIHRPRIFQFEEAWAL